ncbi:conserved hypothetical protein [Bathymodiolus platifrons methanotrophic gill symbiont]|nr:conserved hypothetical protein [Bathymodiolus platifrons methanotrophic gill symbiont]GFO76791.1 hypothetical protein BPLS_P4799 [Bathymodiolus platifrons methanotrophic gill symbiont]
MCSEIKIEVIKMAHKEWRITLTIRNYTGEPVRCENIRCENIDTLDIGRNIEENGTITVYSSTNDRVFCSFRGMKSRVLYKLAMTCPRSSGNNACGYGNAGLKPYNPHKLLKVEFYLGRSDEADWDNPSSYHGQSIDYGDCS